MDSGEPSSHVRGKRGRPLSQLSTEDDQQEDPQDDPKERKRILDQKARQEIREVVVKLATITPNLTKLVELVGSCNLSELLQKEALAQNIMDALVSFKEVVPVLLQLVELVGQSDMVEFLQSTQKIKAEIIDLSSLLQSVRIERQNFTQSTQQKEAPVISQMVMTRNNDQNLMQPALGMTSAVQCGNGSNEQQLINSAPISYLVMGDIGDLPVSECSNYNGDESFDDEQMSFFFQQFDGSFKREVKYNDFNGLEEDLNKVGYNVLPYSLTSIAEKIYTKYGDITACSTLSNYAAFPTRVMFYATVKELDELNLKDVTFTKLGVWRDAILDAQQINLNVQFAKDHLVNIAYAYFGLKARLHEEKLRLELDVQRKKLTHRENCLKATVFFSVNPHNTGLFLNSGAN